MANLGNDPIRNARDLKCFEAKMPLEERLPERSILDVFISSADQRPDATAITMLMTGAPDEQPRQRISVINTGLRTTPPLPASR